MPKKSNKTKNLTTGLTPSKTPTSNAESDKTYKIFETLKTSTVKLPEIILITAENGETVPCSVDLIKRFSYYFYNLIVEFMEANINNLKEPNKANLSLKQFSSAKVIELTLTWCKHHKDDADNHKYLCDHLYINDRICRMITYVEWLNLRSNEAKENGSRKNPYYTEWDTKFFNSIDQDNLVELFNAAFYLKNRKLVEFCTTTKSASKMAKRQRIREIEKWAQKLWEKEETFQENAPCTLPNLQTRNEVGRSRSSDSLNGTYDKFMATFPYPYMNGRLHLGHTFTITKADFSIGFERLNGKRTLFPFGFHCTGMPISAAADFLKQNIKDYGYPPDFSKKEAIFAEKARLKAYFEAEVD